MRAISQQAPTEPGALLFGTYHRRLLGLLLLRPEQSFHLREVERLTGVPSGPAHRELKRMQRVGLLTAVRVGNQVRYQADRGCPIFEELAGIFRKTSGLADVLREALSSLADRIEFAFVYGSVAKGKEGPTSDIDLMVVGEVSFAEVVEALFSAHESLGRQVNSVLMTMRELRLKLTNKDRFVSRVMSEPRLVLLGVFDEP